MYRKFVKTWAYIVGVCISCLVICTIIIDPIGILGMPKIKGINNYKIEQNSYVYVYKPYQYIKSYYDVIFLGSSRVHVGLKAEVADKEFKVYNFGCSGMTLPHMEEILKFVYKANKPKEVYIGLDFFQFGEENFKSIKNGFSKERLKDLATQKDCRIFLRALKENLMLSKCLLPTIRMSMVNKEVEEINIDGWNAKEGNVTCCNYKAFYGSINQYKKDYAKWKFEPEALNCLKRIVKQAEENDVKLIWFMNPINIDLLALLNANDLYEDLERVKKNIVPIVGRLYDFNFINECTKNRYDLYFDAAHFNAIYGERIKADIATGEDTDVLFVLTQDNVAEKLEEERRSNEMWIKDNIYYIKYLKQCAKSAEKIEFGELKNFIGF